MAEGLGEIQHRLYPIGAFGEEEAVGILKDPFCAEDLTAEELIGEWRSKSEAFEAADAPALDVEDSELLPLSVKDETMEKIRPVLESYRYYLPDSYVLAFIPIRKLISPQWSITLEHTHGVQKGSEVPLTDDENALMCLGAPILPSHIDATFLGSPKVGSAPNRFDYVFQFSTGDPNVRYIPMLPEKPVRDVDLSEGSPLPYHAKAIPIAVGVGLPVVHVFRVSTGVAPTSGQAASRLIISNGIHRIFRLSKLGNTHVAAIVEPLGFEGIPNTFIDSPRARLFSPKPVTMPVLADSRFSRLFRWKRSKRVIRLQVTVTQGISYVS